MITSVNNGQVKNIIQLNQKTKARREQGLFVAEGRKMFGEAPKDWISKVYVSEALSGDAELMAQVEKLPYEIVTDSVFRQMSDTQTPQGIMTVLKKPSYTIERAPAVSRPRRSAGSGKCGNYSPYRRGRRSKRGSSDKDLRGYHKPEGYTINHGFCLQNAFPICGKCGIISTGTERQKYPHICGTSAW